MGDYINGLRHGIGELMTLDGTTIFQGKIHILY